MKYHCFVNAVVGVRIRNIEAENSADAARIADELLQEKGPALFTFTMRPPIADLPNAICHALFDETIAPVLVDLDGDEEFADSQWIALEGRGIVE